MSTNPYRRNRGMSYPEVLAATLLLSILLVPAMQALHSALAGSGIQKQQTIDHYALLSKMEAVMARPSGELEILIAGEATPSSLSDSYVTSDGRTLQRQVFLAAHDIDNADGDDDVRTGIDPGAVWVRVKIANSPLSFTSLKTL